MQYAVHAQAIGPVKYALARLHIVASLSHNQNCSTDLAAPLSRPNV